MTFVIYYRVSTDSQGLHGLGMDAQKESVTRYLAGKDGEVIAEFSEVGSASKPKNRVELQKAIALCREKGSVLVIAKLDRLARNAAFLLNLQDSGVKFVAVDMPYADNFTVGILALVAQKERELISERTRSALQAAKRRGQKLGNPSPLAALSMAGRIKTEMADAYAERIAPVIEQIKRAHVLTLSGIADCLNARGFTTPTGKSFVAQSVKNVMVRTA